MNSWGQLTCFCTARIFASEVCAVSNSHLPFTRINPHWCSKAVPAFFINSHVDLCLVGGSQPSKAAGGSGDGGSRASIAAAATRAEKGPFEPLAVPPKLVPSLTTDKVGELHCRESSVWSLWKARRSNLADRVTHRPVIIHCTPARLQLQSLRQLLRKYGMNTDGKKKVCC